MKPRFFKTPSAFGVWLAKNHATKSELIVGYYKKKTGKPSMTWPESVAEALCFGWIDGIRHKLDEESYSIRFTPRREKSIWSAVNLKTARQLIRDGRMMPAGLRAFERRAPEAPARHAYAQGKLELDAKYLRRLRANKRAWKFFESLTPSVQKPSIWWVMSAKKEETRTRRFGVLLDCCRAGRKIPALRREGEK